MKCHPHNSKAEINQNRIKLNSERPRSIFISSQGTGTGKFRELEWERDLELMSPPSSNKKNTLASMDADQSNPNESMEATNDPAIKTDSDVSARSELDTGAVETGDGRPRRLAKPTTKPSEYVYF